MENNKSPGIDGLTSNFYKHFWPILGLDITQVFNYFFKHGLLTCIQRREIITLIFKKGDVPNFKTGVPLLSLLPTSKILTKAQPNDNQSLIRDVIAYANETHTPLALISIDQMKAFNRRSKNKYIYIYISRTKSKTPVGK